MPGRLPFGSGCFLFATAQPVMWLLTPAAADLPFLYSQLAYMEKVLAALDQVRSC